MNETRTSLEAALAYADRGWPVFPVQAPPNKRPLTEHGFHDATTAHDQIIAWWTRWPAAQVGIACGGQAGLVAVDIDDKPGTDGHLSWSELELEHGPAGVGLCMKTPRGRGEQLFFCDPSGELPRKLGIRPGIDLLGHGGYTIVPSPASPGRAWKFGDPLDPEDLVEVPAWIAALAGGPAPAKKLQGPAPASRVIPLTDEQVADIRAALAFVPNDERRDWLRVGFALKATGAGEQAYQLWTEWSKATPSGAVHPKFDEDDQRSTWASARELRLDASEVSLRTLFYMAIERGYEGAVPDDLEPVQVELEDAAGDAEPVPVTLPPAAAPAEHKIRLMDWEDVAELPPIEWQVEGLIPRNSIALLAGDTEAGKSFLAIDLSMRLVHGLPWCGQELVPGDVLYLAGEGQAGLAARFRAWRESHGHLGGAAEDRWCMVSSEIPVLSTKTMHVLDQMIAAVAKAKGRPPALVVIDTLSQGLLDDENDAKVIAPVLRALIAIRQKWGCTILIIHHLVKLNQRVRAGEAPSKPGRDSIRGSGALTRNVDTTLGLVVVGEDSALRELQVWKQKDGSKLPPVPLYLIPVTTDRLRPNGEDEWSCIMVPDACDLPVQEPTKQEPQEAAQGDVAREKARARLCGAVDDVVAALVESGAVDGPGSRGGMSGSAIRQVVTGKTTLITSAIDEAERLGRIRNAGTSKMARWLAVPACSQPVPACSQPVPLPVPSSGSPDGGHPTCSLFPVPLSPPPVGGRGNREQGTGCGSTSGGEAKMA